MTNQIDAQSSFELIAEYTSDVVVRVDRSGLVTYISPAIRKYGYEPGAIVGTDGTVLFHPDDRASIAANAAALARGENDPAANRQHRFRKSDGTWAWVEGNPRVVFDEVGQPVEFLNIFRDITARWEAEEVAREQSQLLEAAFNYTAIGKALVGLDGAFLRINEAFCRIVGYPQSVMLKLDFQTITHPEDLDADLGLLEQLTAGKIESYALDKRYVRHDGAIIWVHLTVSMIRQADGSPKYYVAEVQDLTARRAAEASLKESEARYRLIAENMTDMIVLTRLNGEITYLSPSVSDTGWNGAELLGQSFVGFMHPDDAKAVGKAFLQLSQTGEFKQIRWRGRHGDSGDWIWMESRPTLLRDAQSNEPTGFVDVVRDVTVQVQQEEALALAKQEAEAATAVKSQFLANMSHEIRTPLTAILGFTSLLRDDPSVQGEAAVYVERVAAAGKGLLAIVNDVLDFSKLEAGKFEVRPHPTRLAELCEGTLSMFSGQADAKGLGLGFRAFADVPDCVLIDGDRLRQALINLIGNAVKFTDAGAVEVHLRAGEQVDEVVIDVKDSGPGLDADAQALLFQRFTQIDGSATRRHGGTGLGLAISRGFVEAMGGAIRLTSEPGAGACFSIILPAPVADMPGEGAQPADGGSIDAIRVLVVDDNNANREVVRRLLEAAGAEVTEASNGAEALEQLAVQPVDVVLLDLRMPGLDGAGTLKRLRADEGPNSEIPVLAFTADAELEREGELSAFDGLVRKPIDPVQLMTAVASAVSLELVPPVEGSKGLASA